MRILLPVFCILFVVCQSTSSKTISNLLEKDYENCKNVSDSEFICDGFHMDQLENSDIPARNLTIFQLNQTQVSVLKNSTFENKIIETINIHDNEYLKTIELDAFEGLVGLRYLYIENNKLRLNGLPDPVLLLPNVYVPFRNLQALEILSLRNNLIKNDDVLIYEKDLNELPETLPCLKELDLSENSLRFVGPNIFSPLRRSPLTHLSMTYVELHPTYGIAKGTFKLLPHLESLKIGDNQEFIETLSIGASNHSMLGLRNENFKHLDLRGNHNELNHIPYNLLVEVQETLEELILSYNSFQKIGAKSGDQEPSQNIFPRMDSLVVLELDSCKIDWIRDGAFDNLPLLKNLSLRNNNLDSIPPAVKLNSLESLKISGFIDPNQRDKKEFRLQPNFSEGRLSNLKSLSFGHYKINTKSKIKSSIFTNLNSLTKIELYDSEMTLDTGVFNELGCLKEVSLAQSDDVPICTSILNGSPFQLETLNLTSVSVVNNCEEKFDYTALENIRILDLSNMTLSEPSEHLDISKLIDLEVLNMDGNKISFWNETFLQNNTKIIALSMAYQHDVQIVLTDAMIQDFNQVNVLDLSGNNFICNGEKMAKFYELSKYRDVIGWNNGTGYICLDGQGQSQSFLDLIQNGENEIDGCCQPNGGSTPKDNTKNPIASSVVLSAIVAIVVATVLGVTVAYYAYSNMWYVKFWLAKRKIHKSKS